MPERIQLRRTKGWRKPVGAIVVARPSRWGNPWSVHEDGTGVWIDGPMCLTIPPPGSREEATAIVVDLFRGFASYERDDISPAWTLDDLSDELAGHDLTCWCDLAAPCHADVLLELANVDAA